MCMVYVDVCKLVILKFIWVFFENFEQRGKFPVKLPENSRKCHVLFLIQVTRYRAKIYVFISVQCRKIEENSGKISGKFPKFRKFTKNFPGNFPKNSRKTQGVFYYECNVTARKSWFLLVANHWKSRKISGKFRRKFTKYQKFPEEISPENFPEIPGVFFEQM
jgi:hypothetical protein